MWKNSKSFYKPPPQGGAGGGLFNNVINFNPILSQEIGDISIHGGSFTPPNMTQNDLSENLEEVYTGENTSSFEEIQQIFKFPNEKTCGACKIPHSRNPLCADISQERENLRRKSSRKVGI